MNFFDQLAQRRSKFVQSNLSQPQLGAVLAFEQSKTTANPFDQFDEEQQPQRQIAPQNQPVQQPQQQVQPQEEQAFSRNMIAEGPHTATVSPEEKQRIEQRRADVAYLINNGATKAEIAARMAQDGQSVDSLIGLDDALTYRDAHKGATIPVGLSAPSDPVPQKKKHGQDHGTTDAVVTGALDSISLGSADEIGAAIDAAGNSAGNLMGLGDGKSFSDRYTASRDENRQRLADSQYYHPAAYTGGQIIGGLATVPFGGEIAVGRTALQAAARTGLEGAAFGGIYGFNSSDGDVQDRLAQGGKGALVGGALGGTIGAVGNRVASRIAANRTGTSEGREILNAADRLNAGVAREERIVPVAGHVSNGGLASTLSATANELIIPGHLTGLNRATRRFEENSGLARDRIANETAVGGAEDLNAIAARQNNAAHPGSLAAYEAESKIVSDDLYDQAATLAGQTRLDTPRTIAAIDRKLAQWRAVPGGVAGQDALINLREELANGTFTVDGLRRLRTSFGDSIESSNRTVREAANSLWPSLSEDITGGLSRQGLGDAARAYRAADRNYSARSTNLDSIRLILGDGLHSADRVADNIVAMSRHDYDQLARAISVLPADQAASIRGAIVNNLGRAIPSRQDLTGEAFSLETFLTSWSRDKFSNEAKAAILPARTVRDLDDLARLASANRALGRKGNPSRSGITAGNIATSTATVAGLATGFTTPVVVTALAAWGGGRLLASPGVARALVRLGETGSVEFFARRLSEVARRNPALAQNILGFRDAVLSGKVTETAPTVVSAEQQAEPVPTTDVAPQSADNPFDQFGQ